MDAEVFDGRFAELRQFNDLINAENMQISMLKAKDPNDPLIRVHKAEVAELNTEIGKITAGHEAEAKLWNLMKGDLIAFVDEENNHEIQELMPRLARAFGEGSELASYPEDWTSPSDPIKAGLVVRCTAFAKTNAKVFGSFSYTGDVGMYSRFHKSMQGDLVLVYGNQTSGSDPAYKIESKSIKLQIERAFDPLVLTMETNQGQIDPVVSSLSLSINKNYPSYVAFVNGSRISLDCTMAPAVVTRSNQ